MSCSLSQKSHGCISHEVLKRISWTHSWECSQAHSPYMSWEIHSAKVSDAALTHVSQTHSAKRCVLLKAKKISRSVFIQDVTHKKRPSQIQTGSFLLISRLAGCFHMTQIKPIGLADWRILPSGFVCPDWPSFGDWQQLKVHAICPDSGLK